MGDEKVGDFYGLLGMRVDQGSFDRASQALGFVKKAVAAFVGFKVVEGIAGAVESVVELGGKLNDAEQKTGVAATTLQQYGYAAGLAGADLDEVIHSLGKLNKGLAEAAATGKGPAADGLKALGISLSDPAVKAQNLDEIILEVADKFKKLPDGPKKVAAAMDLFGKSGANLIPFLNEGGDGIERLKKEAIDLGVVLDEDTVHSLDDLGDDVDRVKAGWAGFKNQAVAAILPLLRDLMPGLIQTMKDIVAWTKEHKEEIKEFAATVGRTVKGIVTAIILVFQALAIIFKAVGTAIGVVIAWIVMRAQEIGRAFSEAFDFAKSVAVGLYDGMVTVGNAIADVFWKVVGAIKAAFQAVFDWIEGKVKWVVDKVQAVVNKLNGDAKKTLDRLGVKPEDQTTGNKAAVSVAQAAIPGLDWILGTGESDQSTSSSDTPATPSTTGAPTNTNVDVGGVKVDVAVHSAPGMDENQLAAKVGDVVDEKLTNIFRNAQTNEGAP